MNVTQLRLRYGLPSTTSWYRLFVVSTAKSEPRIRLTGSNWIVQVFVASVRKPDQTYVVTSIEKTGALAVETSELSLLPFHVPTTSAYSPACRPSAVGAAM